MSVDIYLLCEQPLPAKSDWQAAINRQKFPMKMSAAFNPETDSGFWPAEINGTATGFEFYRLVPSDWQHFPEVGNSRNWSSGAQFAIHSRAAEFLAGTLAAVALARTCRGVVYDPQESKSYLATEPDGLVDVAWRYSQVKR